MDRSPQKNLTNFLMLAAMAVVLWLGFGPIQLGGPVSYVIISGNSMEPEIEVGDLVLARQQSSYQVHQRVVYNHPQVGPVFHRIVNQSKGHYTLQGDNNDWLDSYQPTDSEILGKFWFMIPGAGKLIRALRQPIYFVSFVLVVATVIGFIFILPDFEDINKRKGKKRMAKPRSSGSAADIRLDLLLSLGLIALAAGILAVVAFTRPLTFTVTDEVYYQHRHTFTYTASDVGGIYDRSGVKTGDPIYPQLTCKMNLVYTYQLGSAFFQPGERDSLDGSIVLRARISDADGWNRSYLLIPEYPFSGSAISAPSSLDLCRLLETIEEKEEKTGVEIRNYALTIQPEIRISGKVNGIEFSDDLMPEFRFILEENVFRVGESDTGLSFEQEGVLTQNRELSRLMIIFGKGIKVETVRWIALIVLGTSILGSVYPAWSLFTDWKESIASRIQVQHQPLLVNIKEGSLKKRGTTVIQLSSFEDLRKMAERYGAMILHEEGPDLHIYSVQDGTTLYQVSIEIEPDAVDDLASE